MDDNANLETVNRFFKVHSISTNRCHEPSEKCEQTAIRAHSIPSGTALAKLADEGHVIMPQMKLKFPPPAVSSMFSLDDVVAPETPRVTLSVFPAGNDVMVAFAALRSDAPLVTAYLDRILSSDGCFQKHLLSRLILQSCDNFVLAPKYYDSLTQDHKAVICEFYVDTALKKAGDHEDERQYLF